MKNRTETEQKLLDAVTAVMLESGVKGIGVNRVARKAGYSKMLIYRYFGDFNGLIQRWAEENNYWIKKVAGMDVALMERMSLEQKKESAVEVICGQLDEVRRSPVMRELLRWQLTEENEVCTHMMGLAEERGMAITDALSEGLELETDINAAVALITAGIYYLALQADYASVYNGISLDSDEGWDRIKKSVRELMELIFMNAEGKNEI